MVNPQFLSAYDIRGTISFLPQQLEISLPKSYENCLAHLKHLSVNFNVIVTPLRDGLAQLYILKRFGNNAEVELTGRLERLDAQTTRLSASCRIPPATLINWLVYSLSSVAGVFIVGFFHFPFAVPVLVLAWPILLWVVFLGQSIVRALWVKSEMINALISVLQER